MINISRKVSLWLSVRSILEKQRMRLIAPGFRFRAHLGAGLWLGSGLSPLPLLICHKCWLLKTILHLKNNDPEFFTIMFYQLQLTFPLKRQVNITKASLNKAL